MIEYVFLAGRQVIPEAFATFAFLVVAGAGAALIAMA